MLSVHLYCAYHILVCKALNTIAADMEGNIRIDRLLLAHGTARAISYSTIRATILWQSVYPDIALHQDQAVVKCLSSLHDKYVIVPADKTSKNIVCVHV